MKIRTNELTGAALDWAAAKCEHKYVRCGPDRVEFLHPNTEWTAFAPSTDWSQGGRIIEREGIDLYHRTEKTTWSAAIWRDTRDTPGGGQLMHRVTDCPTALIAAMRCFVASKLGDEVEVPRELT